MFQRTAGKTVPDAASTHLRERRYNVIVVMVGINDVLAGGRSANDVMSALQGFYEELLSTGASVVAITPLGAPGFVPR